MIPKVSVIIPVYGVEDYIERCARSLFAQTLKDIEYIFIDDCSPDKSITILLRILEAYPYRRSQVRIIRQPTNSGQAGARKEGIKLAKGEYVIHCDPDDWIELDAYEKLYNKAVETGADIVVCKHYEYDGVSNNIQGTIYEGNAIDALILNKYTFTIWDKLVRNSIIQKYKILPFEGINYGEDLNISVRLYCYASTVTYLDEPLYHYDITRSSAITKTNYENLLLSQAVQNLKMLDDFLEMRSKELKNQSLNKYTLSNQKFWLKWGLYANGKFELWSSLWPESHKHIMKIKSIDWKYRVFLKFFCNKPKALEFINNLKQKWLKI